MQSKFCTAILLKSGKAFFYKHIVLTKSKNEKIKCPCLIFFLTRLHINANISFHDMRIRTYSAQEGVKFIVCCMVKEK